MRLSEGGSLVRKEGRRALGLLAHSKSSIHRDSTAGLRIKVVKGSPHLDRVFSATTPEKKTIRDPLCCARNPHRVKFSTTGDYRSLARDVENRPCWNLVRFRLRPAPLILSLTEFEVTSMNPKSFALLSVFGASILAGYLGLGVGSGNAEQLAAVNDRHHEAPRKPSIKPSVTTAAAAVSELSSSTEAKPARRSQSAAARGPYYVDFRARTAVSYGHAFVWFGKTSAKRVEVAGLHPAGDRLPYLLGHLMWVPAETGASDGDLDPQYLTASYRVYLSEADAKKVFSHIKHLQATSPVWNAQTTNCTTFIGKIASFMGLNTPSHLMMPEEYVNQLRELNGGRQTVSLTSKQ